MDSRKPLTAGEKQEIGELLYRAGFEIANGGTVDETDVADMHRTCRRLLSLLTPPTDAAVREAVEFSAEVRCGRLARGILHIGKRLRAMRADMASQTDALIAAMHALNDAGILMPDEVFNFVSTKRAVQATRLTPEQGERLRGAADTLEAHGEVLEAQWLRAAFPELAEEATNKSGFECLVGMTFTKSEDAEDE